MSRLDAKAAPKFLMSSSDSGAVALIQPIIHDKGSAVFYVSLLFTFNDSFGSGTPLRPEGGAGPTVP